MIAELKGVFALARNMGCTAILTITKRAGEGVWRLGMVLPPLTERNIRMSDIDGISLKILTDWNSGEYNCEGQKQASLQALINTALEEQQKQIDKLNKVVEAAKELRTLVQDSYDGEYDIDSFTLQPIDKALAELKR